MNEKIVTAWIQTYNHGNYVGECLRGVMSQEMPRGYRLQIIIFDDVSTDDTREIIDRETQGCQHEVIKVFGSENIYSTGRKPLDTLDDDQVGDYFTICEGDDLWCDPRKVWIQVRALAEAPSVDLCFHPAWRIDTAGNRLGDTAAAMPAAGLVRFAEVVGPAGNSIPTASLLMRRRAFLRMQKFCRPRHYLGQRDVYLKAFGAARGGAIGLKPRMSMYRVATPGGWTERTKLGKARLSRYSARMRGLHDLSVAMPPAAAVLSKERRRWAWRLSKNPRIDLGMRLRWLHDHWHTLSRRERAIVASGIMASTSRSLRDWNNAH